MKRKALFFFITAIFVSCYSTSDLSTRNLSNVYQKGEQLFHPEFAIVHQSDSTSAFFAKINPKEFLFMKIDERFRAVLDIKYRVVESYEATSILDSGSARLEVLQEDNHFQKVYCIPFKLPKKELTNAQEGRALLIITINDDNKNYSEEFFINVDHSSHQCRQSFLVRLKNDVNPLFRNYLSERDTVRITYRDTLVKTFFVKCYFRSFPLAPPPFSFNIHEDFDYKPDSTFVYAASDSGFISFKRTGFYHFQADSSDKNGVTLFRFANSFPLITTPEQMLEAVRFLTTKREFEEINQNANKKGAMDKFWTDLGQNPERTKLLIKKYYNRVQEANRFFTSHTEGWRTDRGMIYIIFGKPNNVYKSANAESWTYGQANNSLSLSFLFVRVNNPFTDNDYSLTREPLYEGNWYRAVDVWRQGRAYNDF